MTDNEPPRFGRRVLAASILGSGAVFLESTVVNVALPTIARDFQLGMDGLQWVVNAYLLTVGSLILLGGALGDRYNRATIFRLGAVGFAVTSGLCALAPSSLVLAVLRFVQGITGALLVPNSLALLQQVFRGEERGAAIGKWSAGSAASTAIGPLAGGAIVGVASWRWIFALVVPFAVAAAFVLPRDVPQPRATDARRPVDYAGAVLITLGLGAVVAGLIAGPDAGFSSTIVLAELTIGVLLLGVFLAVETKATDPILPLGIFGWKCFAGANASTLLIYGALYATLFLVVLVLQNVAGYSALEAGAALLPVNVLLFSLSSYAGRIGERLGHHAPLGVGAVVVGIGFAMLTRVREHSSYVAHVLPGVLVFGLGLSALVAPLTSAVMQSLGRERAGLASGVNNAVARLAGLVATAAIPLAAGLGGMAQLSGAPLLDGFRRAMWICGTLCVAGGVLAWFTVRPAPEP